MSNLELKEFNGVYKNLLFREENLGIVEVIKSGYLVTGKKKSVDSIQKAAKQIVQSKINRLAVEKKRLEAILHELWEEEKSNG